MDPNQDVPDLSEQGELFGMLAPAFAPLAREYISHSMQQKRLKEQKELEMEMIDAKAEARERRGGVTAPAQPPEEDEASDETEASPADEAIDAAREFEQAIEEFKAQSWCDACKQAADALKDEPVHRARRGLEELREIEEMAEQGADVDDIAARMEDFEVITDALERL